MGILTAVFLGIIIIIIVARIASKTIPRGEHFTETQPHTSKKKKSDVPDEVSHLEALVTVLVKKGVITEEELMEEISSATKYKDID
ncbi:MAG: hypothetical protein ABGX83_11205 [Nitrospira sp.]|nr:hypothetical protein [Candidatus Manganitrophaceae bacterium]HIL34632.1 hypothetical protein [Candidatus Manganitrophaceae bacterium]